MKTTRPSLALALLPLAASAPAQSPISESELFARVERAADSLAQRGELSGVVAIGKGGVPVFQRAYGLANRATGARNTTETAFNLGSINKLFTATAIRQLAADGKLHLDSTLATAWPDYPNADVARRITIRQLLEHRSGVGGDIFSAPAGRTRHDMRHNRDFLPLFVDRPLDFEPGAQRRYSNAGYVLLGALVERVSGIDYYEYVRDRIVRPAGLTRTGHFHVDSLPDNTAIGYRSAERGGEANTMVLPGRGSAAGGGYSTAADLLRFVHALRERRVKGGPPPGIGAGGGGPGINAVIEGDLPGGYDVVVLTNLDPPAASTLARIIRGLLGATDG